jgi:hypothetical protein
MGDAVLADPRGLRQLPVRLNEEFNNALDMETFESDSAPHPVESPKENRVLSMSMDDGMDDGLKWIDAWTTAQEDRAFDDALGFNSATISSWPEQNNQALGSETGFLHGGNNAWMAGRQVGAFNDALGLDWQDQTPLATGVWNNGAFNTPGHEMIPGWTASQDEQQRRVIAAEPGSQAPGDTVNGVALRLPLTKLPSYNQSAMASGYYAQEVLTKVSAGTSLMAERKAACMLRKIYADSK